MGLRRALSITGGLVAEPPEAGDFCCFYFLKKLYSSLGTPWFSHVWWVGDSAHLAPPPGYTFAYGLTNCFVFCINFSSGQEQISLKIKKIQEYPASTECNCKFHLAPQYSRPVMSFRLFVPRS